MRRQGFYRFSGDHLELEEIDRYYRVVESAIRLYYSDRNPEFGVLFPGYNSDTIRRDMQVCLDEHDLTMSLSLLSALEAAFRIDYSIRCRRRMRDRLSRDFRELYAAKGWRVSFRTDILSAWVRNSDGSQTNVEELKKAVDYRNWLAHGRYRVLKTGRRYTYRQLYAMADKIISRFPLQKFPQRGFADSRKAGGIARPL